MLYCKIFLAVVISLILIISVQNAEAIENDLREKNSTNNTQSANPSSISSAGSLTALAKPAANNTQLPSQTHQVPVIPNRFKETTALWAKGEIDVSEFAKEIKNLVNQKIIQGPKIPNLTPDSYLYIPDWTRQPSKWYSDGSISEDEYLNTIGYLLENGIIIQTSTQMDPNIILHTGDILAPTNLFQTFYGLQEVPKKPNWLTEYRMKYINLYLDTICHLSDSQLLSLMDAWINATRHTEREGYSYKLNEYLQTIRDSYAISIDNSMTGTDKTMGKDYEAGIKDMSKKLKDGMEKTIKDLNTDEKEDLKKIEKRLWKYFFFTGFGFQPFHQNEKLPKSYDYFKDIDMTPVDKFEDGMRKSNTDPGHSKDLAKEFDKWGQEVQSGKAK